MGRTRTNKFREDAVHITLTSGLTRKQVADDLGAEMSTLNKWITTHRDTDSVLKEDLGLAQENDRLRRENRILKKERAILKKSHGGFKRSAQGLHLTYQQARLADISQPSYQPQTTV